jgi:DNA-binding response OmpR family regulator
MDLLIFPIETLWGMAKVLVIEDDQSLTAVIRKWLVMERHSVDCAVDGVEGLYLLQNYQFDVAILDWGLPSLNGVEVLRKFRGEGGTTPILMLTAKDSLGEKRIGLDTGADDYLVKPFEMEELAARVRALTRRPATFKPNVLRMGDLELDKAGGTVKKGGREIALVPKEFAILEFLMRHPGEVFNSSAIVTRVWPAGSDASPENIPAYVTRLRKKLSSPGRHVSMLRTIHGLGYKLERTDVSESKRTN